jgi:hypothetical protein
MVKTLTGKCIPVEIEPEDLVYDLKRQIEAKEGIDVELFSSLF